MPGPNIWSSSVPPVSWDVRLDYQRVAGSVVAAWLPAFEKDFYELAGVAIVKPDAEYYWGRDALNCPQPGGPFISIFKRR